MITRIRFFIIAITICFSGLYTPSIGGRFSYWMPVVGAGVAGIGYYVYHVYRHMGTSSVTLDDIEQAIIKIEQDNIMCALVHGLREYIEKLEQQVVILREQGVSEDELVSQAELVVECSLEQFALICNAQEPVGIIERLHTLQQLLVTYDQALEECDAPDVHDHVQGLRSRVDLCLFCTHVGLSVLGHT